jgi:hypothetical protein
MSSPFGFLFRSVVNMSESDSVLDLGLGIKRGNESINLGRFDRLLPAPASDPFAGYRQECNDQQQPPLGSTHLSSLGRRDDLMSFNYSITKTQKMCQCTMADVRGTRMSKIMSMHLMRLFRYVLL